MSWTIYRVAFRLLSPLHIGYLKQGNVQRTRPYVIGRALWGALTARLTRDYTNREEGEKAYEKVGKEVNNHLAFTYLFPSTDSKKVSSFSWESEDFSWDYLGTYPSTALEYEQNTALEGSLHETEYIAPYTQSGQPVYLLGYIFEKDGCPLRWKEALERLQFGGERCYGWGRVALCECERADPKSLFGRQIEFRNNGDYPVITVLKDGPLLAHTCAQNLEAKGEIEPLVGREWRSGYRVGGYVAYNGVCFAPGSIISEKTDFCVKKYGIWERLNGYSKGQEA